MTHDFRIIPPHYGILRFDQSDVLNRLTELENDRRYVTIFVQKFPEIEKCCKNLNLKFDVILKEFKLIKNRVEELAETAHEALDKSIAVEEKIKILVDIKPDHLKDLDSRVTELAKRFTVVKTTTEQNREICTAVQDQVGNLKTNIIKPIVKAEVDKEAIDLKDELDHIKTIIEDDLETFRREIEDKLKNKPGGGISPDLTDIKTDLENFKKEINDRLNQPGSSTPNITKLLTDFKKEINDKIALGTDVTQLKTRISEIADVADSNLTKIEKIAEELKPATDVTQLIEDFKIIKTTSVQNREICTAVKAKTDQLNKDLMTAKNNLKSAVEKTETTLLTEIEGVKALIKTSKLVDSKELEKLKIRINEIADVAHEAGKCCDEIDGFKNKLKTIETDIVKVKEDVVIQDKKLDDVKIKCEADIKEAVIRDEKLQSNIKKLEDEGMAHNAEIENLGTAATVRDQEINELRETETKHKNDITNLKDDITAHTIKLNAVQTKCETDIKRLEENGKIRDDEIDKLTDAKVACEVAVKELKDSVKVQINKTKKLTDEAVDRDTRIEQNKIKCDDAIKTMTKADSDLKSALDNLTKRHDTDFKKVEKEAVEIKNKTDAELKTLKTRLNDEAGKIEDLEMAQNTAIQERKAASTLIERTRSELNDAINKHRLLSVTVQGHTDHFVVLDRNFKTLETLMETRHEKLRAAINALDKSLTSKITKVVDGTDRDINDLKKLIAEQTKTVTDLKSAQDKLKADLYKKLKADYDELKEAIEITSGLTIDAVKEALDWNDLINRVEFLENEVDVNIKTRFVNLENSLNELQSIASDAHDLATLLQQALKNVPDEIKAVKEAATDLKISTQEIEGIAGKNEKNITDVKEDIKDVESTLKGISDKTDINKNETDILHSLIDDLDDKTDDMLMRVRTLENRIF
ncbi:chromosome segregation ATPase [lymphocystis disease virus-China]|uniref:Uncharacterized protein n=2 Tax=Lymphocystis disease virus 2 TaxID=159183 RepID=A0A6F8X1V0_9VIRU|nr:chromosome segregation ATPase [lymphocystis disease virus-China]AAU11079.1 chromosome segregation ATPase [lymphocystis disease virus-China]BCB67550.1 hypothetical protein [Lymphocystis disease virus 2]